jgi:hypothetical protein
MQKPPPLLDPRHDKVRALLRLFGPPITLVGLVMTAIGLISFFSAFGTFQPPRYFWAALVGLPLIGIGLGISQVAYVGEIFRYFSGEVTPVARDTFNTMAEGTRPGVETMAHAVGRGITSAMREDRLSEASAISCDRCGSWNPTGARFCNQCGAGIENATCPACGTSLTPAARFCNQCGKPVG